MNSTNRPTRSEQREAARAKAKALREQHKRQEKARKFAIRLGVVGAVLGVAAIVVVAIVGGLNGGSENGASNGDSKPKNMSFGNGIKIGAGLEAFTATNTPAPTPSDGSTEVPTPTEIVIYVDYQCPICKIFETPNIAQIESWVSSGAATLEVHPLSFLDGRGSPNEYSSRAANAAVCVAEYSPNNFFKFNSLLFENQPQEGTPGPENDELISRTVEAGVSNADQIATCINEKTFGGWIKTITDEEIAAQGAGFGTPAIFVNGQPYPYQTAEELANPARFAQFVQSVTVG